MKPNRLTYLTLIFLIGVISCYDNMLSAIYHETLPEVEQNPIGVYLISHYGVEGFVLIKSVCTVLAVILMHIISMTKYRVSIIWVFLFQCGLFYYLSFYVPDGDYHLGRTPIGDVINYISK